MKIVKTVCLGWNIDYSLRYMQHILSNGIVKYSIDNAKIGRQGKLIDYKPYVMRPNPSLKVDKNE